MKTVFKVLGGVAVIVAGMAAVNAVAYRWAVKKAAVMGEG